MEGSNKPTITQQPTGTSYVTTVLTKIVEGFDALETCPEAQSLNIWRRQCFWAMGLLGAIKSKQLSELADENGLVSEEVRKSDPVLVEVDKLTAEWEPDPRSHNTPLTSFENTIVKSYESPDDPSGKSVV